MFFPNSDDPQGAAGLSPSRYVSEPQSNGIVSNSVRSFHSVNVTPISTDGSILNTPRGIPGVGRRAHLGSMIEQSIRASPVQRPGGDHSWSGQNPMGGAQLNQLQGIADLIKQLGSEIGSQISAKLSQGGQTSTNVDPSTPLNTAENFDLSKLNLILKSDIKEPPHFRGDSSDRCTVTEWQEIMQTYLARKGCSLVRTRP